MEAAIATTFELFFLETKAVPLYDTSALKEISHVSYFGINYITC